MAVACLFKCLLTQLSGTDRQKMIVILPRSLPVHATRDNMTVLRRELALRVEIPASDTGRLPPQQLVVHN